MATLITDLFSYNTDVSADDRDDPRRAARPWFQPHWVGDLTLSLRLTRARAGRQFRLELIKAGISNRCEIDLATGQASLFHGEIRAWARRLRPGLDRAGHATSSSFANVDGRLTLWVDGALPFGDGRTFESSSDSGTAAVPTAADLEPARIAGTGAAIDVDSLVLKRDVYYTLEPAETDYANLDAAGPYRFVGPLRLALRPEPVSHAGPSSGARLSDRAGPLPDAG